MKRNIFILLFLLSVNVTNLFATNFTQEQKQNLIKAFLYGKTLKAKDGMTFGLTLSAILYQESSAGINNIDKVFDSIGPFQIRPHVARKLIREYHPEYKYLLKDNYLLLKKLLHDFNFNLVLAGTHVVIYYNEALRRKMPNPWLRTVSRYNGGWYNYTYINNIRNKVNILETIL